MRLHGSQRVPSKGGQQSHMGGTGKGDKQDSLFQTLHSWISALGFLTQKTALNSTVTNIVIR